MKNEFTALANNAEWSEKAIEKYLVKKMEDIGGKALKYSNANKSGYPDRICLFPGGKIVFVELKSKKGKVSPLQRKRLDELYDLGFTAVICPTKESVDWFVGFIVALIKNKEDNAV